VTTHVLSSCAACACLWLRVANTFAGSLSLLRCWLTVHAAGHHYRNTPGMLAAALPS
jgi:hypothetical protein